MRRQYLIRALQVQKKKRMPRIPRPRPPDALGREYARALISGPVNAVTALCEGIIIPSLGGIIGQANAIRGDDAVDVISRVFGEFRVAYARQYSDREAEALASRYAARGRDYAQSYIKNTMQTVLGVDVLTVSPAVAQQVSAFTRENVKLIESLGSSFIDDVEARVIRTVRTGAQTSDLVAEIRERYGVSESRATLIARDQIQKLNGEVNRIQQVDLGIDSYTRRAVRDVRVRETHAALDGQVFKWADPPAVGHPGEEYQCRCTAEPNLQAIFDELGKD